EELDAVVAVRVVARRDDHGEVEAVAAEQQRRRRRRQDAAHEDLTARGRNAGRERGLEHLAALARVADDEHPGGCRPRLQRRSAPACELTPPPCMRATTSMRSS